MRESFHQLLTGNRNRPPKAFIAIIVLAVVLALGLRLVQVGSHVEQFASFDESTIILFYNTALAIVISLIASILYSRYIASSEQSLSDKISETIGADLAASVLEDLSFYNGVICENWDARVELHPHRTKRDRFTCYINYNFRKKLFHSKVRIRFYRITPAAAYGHPPMASEALDKDFIWDNNESAFTEGVTDDDYSVDYIAIDQQNVRVIKTTNSDVVDFEGQPERASTNEIHRIEFRVAFPIERESAMIVTHEWATKRATLQFDYSRVLGEISCWHRELTGIRASPLDHSSVEGNIKYINEGWALPKSGYVFCWWKP